MFLELFSRKLHYTYSFAIQSMTWKNCLGFIFQGNLISATQKNVFGIIFCKNSGWSVTPVRTPIAVEMTPYQVGLWTCRVQHRRWRLLRMRPAALGAAHSPLELPSACLLRSRPRALRLQQTSRTARQCSQAIALLAMQEARHNHCAHEFKFRKSTQTWAHDLVCPSRPGAKPIKHSDQSLSQR